METLQMFLLSNINKINLHIFIICISYILKQIFIDFTRQSAFKRNLHIMFAKALLRICVVNIFFSFKSKASVFWFGLEGAWKVPFCLNSR